MKKFRIKAAAILLASAMTLTGCAVEASTDNSSSSSMAPTEAATEVEVMEETEAPTEEETEEPTEEATEEPTEEAAEEVTEAVVEVRYPVENLGLTLAELEEQMGRSAEMGTTVEPPRRTAEFGDGIIYALTNSDPATVSEVICYDFNLYTGLLLPDLKIGMSLEDIRNTYELSEPNTSNLNGTYASEGNVTYNGKNYIIFVDFGNDENCKAAAAINVTIAE